MLKKLTIIAFFTGAGQLFSILALKWVSQHGSAEQLKAISQVDSIVLLMLNLVGLGLQSAAMRDLAMTADWKKEFQHIQSARIALGFVLAALALMAFLNPYYLLFLAAPLIAWNGDYALYARGHPIAGSLTAFIRLLIPFSAIMLVVVHQPGWLTWVYVSSLLITYMLTNLGISLFLGTPVAAIPRFKNMSLYLKSMPLGIVVLSLYFIGQGLILVIPYFYNNAVVAVAFVGIKFYVIYKGVLRIIHQAFLKDMVFYEVCFKVDQLASLIGLSFAAFTLCFPGTFIHLFFGEKYLPEQSYFILLSLAALVYSLFASFIIKAMLEKKDIPYAVTSFLAAVFTLVVCIICSFIWQSAYSVGVSLLAGEVFFATGMLILMNRPGILKERMLFLLKNLAFILVPLTLRYFMGDKMISFSIAGAVFVLIIAAVYFKKFNIAPVN